MKHLSDTKMEIQRIDSSVYKNYFSNPYHIFNSVSFSELNKDKCDNLHYLLFKDSKVRFGIVLGERGECLCSPFSAPFGGFSFNKNEGVWYLEQAVTLLKGYGKSFNKQIRISLPPTIYNPTIVSKSVSAFMREGAVVDYVDLNFQYEISHFVDYEKNIDRSARKNLHNSQKIDFTFLQLDSNAEADVARAYNVIRQNREERGFPLRMTLDMVLATIKIIPADFFVCSLDGVDMAAAQVFHVSEDVYQVVYWGDIPQYAKLRVMNFFTYKIFEHYYHRGIRILDIGPSTEKGIPNYGLCDFKENIGCSVSMKYTFIL